MLTTVNSIISKKLLIVLSLVIAISMSLSGIKVSANTDSIEKLAKTDEYQETMAIVESALVLENGTYKIDENLAEGQLSQKEITEINTYFQNIDPELLDIAIAPKNPEGISTFAIQLVPVVIAFLGTLAAFVGWELAAAITADFYKWGVTSACKKWKSVKVVKSFCTANDYL